MPNAFGLSGRAISFKFRSELLAIKLKALKLPPVPCPSWPSPVGWLWSEPLEGRLCWNSVGVRNFWTWGGLGRAQSCCYLLDIYLTLRHMGGVHALLEPCFWMADLSGHFFSEQQPKNTAKEGDRLEEYRKRARGFLYHNKAFQSASYGLTIFAILGPFAALGLIAVAFGTCFVKNCIVTVLPWAS
ncbi:hypothetical protein M0657_003578 [Pyricularia oryzae]|nr:hypothetical protein M0657_003578 [Pyricularia oryzae]KAI7928842.1 hypothetical protein M9X92_001636 [Pyricularia oryzae]